MLCVLRHANVLQHTYVLRHAYVLQHAYEAGEFKPASLSVF